MSKKPSTQESCRHDRGVEVHQGEVYCFHCGEHLGKAIKKSDLKRVSGEASGLMEEIRKHAKTPSEVYETADALFDKIRYGKTREQRARLRQEWLDYLRSKKGWVFIDIVLGVVAQQEAEDVRIRVALAKTCTKLNDQIGRLERAEAEQNQKLVEPYAKLAHQIWSEFIEYCMRIGAPNGPEFQRKSIWEKWYNQSQTPYEKLSEKEKESDRFIARRFLALLSAVSSQESACEGAGENQPPKTETQK